ncbi:uncharacterized protein LOC113333640 [Papaver somniferum]|uniref:uncharacterized protein LOC113333640 n=1 Tax=Papaver somniferum TaxID=3469 RepID=UPI000E6F52F7|nr:uncharacterized protein LOC113333640 [Papaver somniferum]
MDNFHTVSTLDEKKGGRVPLNSSVAEFNEWIDNCELLHATRTGLQFSWSNGRCGRKRILCNLDRFLFNSKWLEKYPGWKYHVTARGFLQVIIDAWREYFVGNPIYTFMSKLKHMKIILKKWNWEIFGNVQVTLREAEKKVTETDILSDADPQNLELLNKYITARGVRDIASQNYHTTLCQKLKINWIKFGEANTSFFTLISD